MVHKHAIEALDRTLKDILSCGNPSNLQLPFGGKVIVLGEDFRQILPVVTYGGRQDIVNASLSSSYIWEACKVHTLTKNMSLNVGSDPYDIQQTRIFADWFWEVREGKVGGSNDGEAIIDIQEDLMITVSSDPIGSLIEFVYLSILQNFNIPCFFEKSAILAPTHEVVDEVNDRLISLFPGDEKEYPGSDSICQSNYVYDQFDASLYSPDVLNGLKPSGLPNHKLPSTTNHRHHLPPPPPLPLTTAAATHHQPPLSPTTTTVTIHYQPPSPPPATATKHRCHYHQPPPPTTCHRYRLPQPPPPATATYHLPPPPPPATNYHPHLPLLLSPPLLPPPTTTPTTVIATNHRRCHQPPPPPTATATNRRRHHHPPPTTSTTTCDCHHLPPPTTNHHHPPPTTAILHLSNFISCQPNRIWNWIPIPCAANQTD